MKITKQKLKQIIREEFKKTLKERGKSPVEAAEEKWRRDDPEGFKAYIKKLTARKEAGEKLPPGSEEILMRANKIKDAARPGYTLESIEE
jgi:hypothetical protein